LKDPGMFSRFHISQYSGTIEWENGADLAPEYLESLLPGSTLTARPPLS
jgi:hypothetical protein